MTRKEKVLGYLEHQAPNPMRLDELCAVLEVPQQDIPSLQSILDELEREGLLARTKKQRYSTIGKLGMIAGRFIGNERGFGFVEQEGEDLFIGGAHTGQALNGDTVLARVILPAKGERRAEGEIIRVLEHANRFLVGTYQDSGSCGFVLPDDRKVPIDIHIRLTQRNGAKNDDKVVAEITDWGSGDTSPEGRITEVLGNKYDVGTDILSILRSHGIPTQFPDDVRAEAARVGKTVAHRDKKGRLDLRKLSIITIDGADSKDLDDAISVEPCETGNYRLGVHIADVSHYVRPGSALNREAFERGTSTYLVDRVVPMLPEELSNGICSLNPHVDRLALSVFMTIDAHGNVVAHEIAKSVIRSATRMTYEDVTKILVDKDARLCKKYAKLVPQLKRMQELSGILRKRRRMRGSIDFDFPECKIILDETGKPVDIQKYQITVSNQIIEDFMLLCNETVAEHMCKADIPFVYRVHEKPGEEKTAAFLEFLKNFGYTFRNPEHLRPKDYQKLLNQMKGRKEERIVSTVMLRSLMKARYSDENLGHFGLAAKYYCHFTSPIRRYPDLVIHGIIKDMLDGKQPNRKQLERFVSKAALQASEREITAQEAERDADDLKKAEYMQAHVGETFTGVISSVTSFGMFVELNNTVEGLVRMADLQDDYYRYDERNHQLVGERTKKIYRIGDTVEIIVARADIFNKQIDFVLNDEAFRQNGLGDRKTGRKKTHKKPAKVSSDKKAKRTTNKTGGKPPKKADSMPAADTARPKKSTKRRKKPRKKSTDAVQSSRAPQTVREAKAAAQTAPAEKPQATGNAKPGARKKAKPSAAQAAGSNQSGKAKQPTAESTAPPKKRRRRRRKKKPEAAPTQ